MLVARRVLGRHWIAVVLLILFVFAPISVLSEEANTLPQIDSVSTDFVAMTSKLSFDKVIALYGENLDTIIFGEYTVWFGSEQATAVSGNATEVNVTFSVTPKNFIDAKEYAIQVKDGDTVVSSAEQHITVSNPLYVPYASTHPKKYFRKIKKKHNRLPTKRTVGLNVHWTLGAPDDDDELLFAQKLDNSQTKWVREHISFAEVMGENQRGWLERYDRIFREYDARNMRVVAMLGYGDGDDRFAAPSISIKEWKKFIRIVSKRYRNDVDAWEIWNEPDSASFLHPNTVDAVLPLMKATYPLLKHYDPQSIVLNGPIGDIQNTGFVRQLYKKGGKYFDELSIHLYYCDEFVHNGNTGQMKEDLDALYQVIPKKRRKEKIWITEIGCSLGTSGVDAAVQRRFLAKATKQLARTQRFRVMLMYTIRDRPYLNSYEANFGLMSDDGTNKSAWKWYRQLPRK